MIQLDETKPQTLYGMPIVINPLLDKPKMALSPALTEILLPYQAQFVDEMNAWLRDRFGIKSEMYLVTPNPRDPSAKTIVIGPVGYAKMVASLNKV